MLSNTTTKAILEETLRTTPRTQKSVKSWSLSLQEITFHPDYGSFINKLFDRTEKLGFLSISYDYGCYFPEAKLNLNFSKGIHTFRVGDSLSFGSQGFTLFPEKKVHENMISHIFFFQSKMNREACGVFQQGVNQLVSESNLLAELERICASNQEPNKLLLDTMADLLNYQIECAINNTNAKFIQRFDWQFHIKDEWSFFGVEEKMEKKIKLKLLKKSI